MPVESRFSFSLLLRGLRSSATSKQACTLSRAERSHPASCRRTNRLSGGAMNGRLPMNSEIPEQPPARRPLEPLVGRPFVIWQKRRPCLSTGPSRRHAGLQSPDARRPPEGGLEPDAVAEREQPKLTTLKEGSQSGQPDPVENAFLNFGQVCLVDYPNVVDPFTGSVLGFEWQCQPIKRHRVDHIGFYPMKT